MSPTGVLQPFYIEHDHWMEPPHMGPDGTSIQLTISYSHGFNSLRKAPRVKPAIDVSHTDQGVDC